MKKFNYVIGHYWDNTKQIGCYTYYTTVQYGTEVEANEFLEYVKRKSPDHDWKILNLRSSNELSTTSIIS